MLTENDIIEAVCRQIKTHGYDVLRQLTTRERGLDIVARKHGVEPIELRVEAKGETSSKEVTNRYGKPFNSAQIRDHVANAIYTAATMLEGVPVGHMVRVAIALPGTKGHRKQVQAVIGAMTRLEIGVFWVAPDGAVELVAPWQL
jgi:hypothetical protein